jgi:UDP-glucose 4-epimerase
VSAWLVTGGAGYIGAHVVRALSASGREAVVLDDLSTGFASFVPEGVPLVHASVLDAEAVRATVRDHAVAGVVHLAGWKYAGVSVREPLRFYRENVSGMERLLSVVVEEDVPSFVFSSSASVYGTPRDAEVTEQTPTAPESPYGETKLAGEWLLRAVARAHGLRQVSLR